MELRAERPSIRLFSYLQSQSVFPPEYAYLFILLVIGLAAKVLQLPLLSKSAKLSLAAPKLRPEIQRIRGLHRKDVVTMNKKIAEAYRSYGASPAAGCLKSLIELVLIIWIFVALGSYAPQLRLDGAQFLWAASVADRDLGLMAVWIVTGIFMTLISPRLSKANTAQLFAGTGVWLGVVAAIAWFAGVPAYLFIFSTLLWVMTAVLLFVMIGFHASRA
jgi:membrane protein insertase Oxa1/YidC/SpoIIIJ